MFQNFSTDWNISLNIEVLCMYSSKAHTAQYNKQNWVNYIWSDLVLQFNIPPGILY